MYYTRSITPHTLLYSYTYTLILIYLYSYTLILLYSYTYTLILLLLYLYSYSLYNLSTVIDIQHKLVSQGFVGVMLTLWPDAKQDKDLCLLSFLSVCHLACGRTNTTQMAQDGCTDILCFISEYRKNADFGNYNFTVDVHYRCSAALRNLLSVVSNQKAMVEQVIIGVFSVVSLYNCVYYCETRNFFFILFYDNDT
jgi:hypothetical protein